MHLLHSNGHLIYYVPLRHLLRCHVLSRWVCLCSISTGDIAECFTILCSRKQERVLYFSPHSFPCVQRARGSFEGTYKDVWDHKLYRLSILLLLLFPDIWTNFKTHWWTLQYPLNNKCMMLLLSLCVVLGKSSMKTKPKLSIRTLICIQT